ncbi:MAG: serine/threonine protein kinase, partial [Clostridiaceae bacterium]|nr:serine/threonine protein kinase [Clostridiaceae bacterium]
MIPNIEPDDQYLTELVERIKPGRKGGKSNPHKYILLLTIIAAMETEGQPNEFYFDKLEPEYKVIFNNYCPSLPEYSNVMDLPFYHLQTSGFWTLKYKDGMETKFRQYEATRLTRKRLLETVEYAYLPDDIFTILQKRKPREKFKVMMIQKLGMEEYLYEESSDNSGMVEESTSLFSHERNAINTLSKELSTSRCGELLNNLIIFDRQSNNYYEYDCILIAHSGIYVVELKHWSGNIQIIPHNWLVNNTQYRTDPHKNNSFKCRILKGLYQHQFRTYPDVWVESVVVLTNPNATVEGATIPTKAADQGIHSPTFASIEDFLRYILRREATVSPVLNNNQISAIVKHLLGLNKPQPGIKYTVPGYETLAYLSQRPECIELLARP